MKSLSVRLGVILIGLTILGYADDLPPENFFPKSLLWGNWILFATAEGKDVGQTETKFYYNKDTLQVIETEVPGAKENDVTVIVDVWRDNPQIHTGDEGERVYLDYQKGFWIYRLDSKLSNVPRPVPKDSILPLLLKALKKSHPIINVNGRVLKGGREV